MKQAIQQTSQQHVSAVARSIRKSLVGSFNALPLLPTNRKTLTKIAKKVGAAAKITWQVMSFPFQNLWWRYSIVACGAFGLIGLGFVLQELPSPSRLTSSENFAVSSQIFDRHGKLLYEIYADEHRIPIKLDTLPPYVYQASIAIEDQHFYQHWGFDLTAIARAVLSNLTGNQLEGGSTITQQLVKNALLTSERSWQRKIKEGILAVVTEMMYSKNDILEMYLNYISYGGTSVGIESAAQSYFGKSAKDLTVGEAALLAGLPQAPSRYSPFGSDPQRAKDRQADVLRRMYEDDFITKLQEEEAKSEVLEYALDQTDIEAPHFVFYVRDLLYEKYGVETVEKGGLRVTTTLDLDLQQTAQASLSAELERLTSYDVGNAAALVLKPNTGEILAMIGSQNYFDSENDGQVNVTLAERQPGSSIKPIMYATAFENKVLNPGTILVDSPTCFLSAGQKPYCPKNYDGSYRGPVTVRQSLGNSLNIPAVKSLRALGIANFIDQAKKMGITTWNDPSRYGLSLTLGGGEIRMIDLAQAFSVLADQGVKVPLTSIIKVEDYKGKVLEENNFEQTKNDLEYLSEYEDSQAGSLTRVMNRAPAYLASHIMQDNQARQMAFGSHSELVIPNQVVSAKTGTTNDLRDNWTVGFTPEYLVMTWVGNNDNTPMNRRLVSGVTGAAPIFNDIMSYILSDQQPIWQEKPPDVESGLVCPTGMPPQAGESCQTSGPELYWNQSKPSASLRQKMNVWIDPTTGLPPLFGQQIEGLVLEEHTIIQDPVTDSYCLDCNRAVNEEGKPIQENQTIDEFYSPENRVQQEASQAQSQSQTP
ncbi:MAG: penicillin-binding protein [Candidatus Pacebacteria bacterium CG_4_10_14_0_8_um_filter_43_12]|nr:MAG: penicillin-binding protein [Candidatus Pacebacteria bacterium CG10_big_fil_rev_8_21_14_0_10_44_11]PIY79301.1 MAG: penicillin-binding protein [Candidatus Pacebacteria bacterium CG_4_10_14_0_8_um_filter_43_12]